MDSITVARILILGVLGFVAVCWLADALHTRWWLRRHRD